MQQLDIFGRTKQDDAIDFIRKHEPSEGYFLAFSGGKDSIVTYDLTVKSGVKFTAYYSATGIDPPELMRFIRKNYPSVTWLKPEFSFFELILKKQFPSRYRRWCCDFLKEKPSKKIPLKHRIMGMRKEESFKRSIRPNPDYHKRFKQWIYKPIFDWLEWEIWEYIERYRLDYCSLYDEGFDRIGCVICPYICGPNSRKLRLHKERWPRIYARFEKTMVEYFELKKDDLWEESAQELINNWYEGNGTPMQKLHQKKFKGF